MEWTQQKLEELYVSVQKKAMTDEAFRKELLADPTKAIEALTGEKLPDGFKLKVIENDPAYTATMVLPDMIGRELTDEESETAAGGLSMLLIVSACAAAVGVGPDVGACAAKGCVAEFVCGGEACAAAGSII